MALALLEAANDRSGGVVVGASEDAARAWCLVTGSHRVCGTFIEAIGKHAADARKWLEGGFKRYARVAGAEIGLAEHFLDEPGRQVRYRRRNNETRGDGVRVGYRIASRR